MDIKVGSKNIKFGWVWMLLYLLCGAFLQRKMGDPNWGKGATQIMKAFFAAAHVHGLGLASLNILYGLTIDRANVSDTFKKAGSLLAIAGAVLFSLALSLAPFILSLKHLVSLGGLLTIISVIIIIIGQCKCNTSNDK